ncbi:MAG: DUF1616 domain-containing protein [Candidatus Aenigmarchaeota archaeon]|nr:DUF1616 domain-containing protein [Candidatus Aenigmarchaeota archaeon]
MYTKIKNKKQIFVGLIIFLVLSLFFYKTGIYWILRGIRIVLGLLLVLFIPGYISTFFFFEKKEIDFLERIALSVGLSISFVVLTVMFSNLYLSIPINLYTILAQIAFICLFFTFAKPIKKAFAFFYTKAIHPLIKKLNLSHKQKYIFISTTVVGFLLTLTIFYPVIFDNTNKGKITFNELYNTENARSIQYLYSKENVDKTIGYENINKKLANNYDDKIALIGYEVGDIIQSGEDMKITLYWSFIEDLKEEYKVKLDFTDSKGKTYFSIDYDFAQSEKEFKQGDAIKEESNIKIPFITEEKDYFLRIGLIDAKGTSVPALYGKFIDPDGRSILGILHLKPDENYVKSIYNSTMEVIMFYPQKNIEENTTGIEMGISLMKNLENKIMFLGADIDKKEIMSGEKYHIFYFWKCLQETKKDYTAFVHIVDQNNKIAFQQDHNLPFRTSKCKKDIIYVEQYDVTVPLNIQTGTYTIKAGLYDKKTGTRLPLADSDKNVLDIADIFVKSKESVKQEFKNQYSGMIDAFCYNPYENKDHAELQINVPNIHIIEFTDEIKFIGYGISKESKDPKNISINYFWKIKNIKNDYAVKTSLFSTEKEGLLAETHNISLLKLEDKNEYILCEQYNIYDNEEAALGNFVAIIKLINQNTGESYAFKNSMLEITDK